MNRRWLYPTALLLAITCTANAQRTIDTTYLGTWAYQILKDRSNIIEIYKNKDAVEVRLILAHGKAEGHVYSADFHNGVLYVRKRKRAEIMAITGTLPRLLYKRALYTKVSSNTHLGKRFYRD